MSAFNFARNFEALADAFPNRPLVIFRDRRFSYGQTRDRARRLANYLRGRGLGEVRPRAGLCDWESGQDHVGLYLYNGNEYLEGMLGSYMARVVPFNINYRYVAGELDYLMKDATPRALIYHARFAPMVAALKGVVPGLEILLQVEDGSGEPLVEGAEDYEQALAGSSAELPDTEPSPDDLYMVYTGGTTGMPKGVLWRQHDIFMGAMGGSYGSGRFHKSMQSLVGGATRVGAKLRCMPVPPFMHGAAHWMAFVCIHNGGAMLLQDTPEKLICDEIWSLAEREKATVLLIVGDAFGVPLLEQLEKKSYDLAALRMLSTGGAILSSHVKRGLQSHIEGLYIRDTLGSSESGAQAVVPPEGGEFELMPSSAVASHTLDRLIDAGDPEVGYLVCTGHIPLGYLGDQSKTEKTFVRIGERRYSVPGDHAQYTEGGRVKLLGRGSVCINSGGEKIYPEEVEEALKAHPGVYDVLVVGVPDEKWGARVTAVVEPVPGQMPALPDLHAHCETRLSRYKLPRQLVEVKSIQRSPAGKADYRWAREVACRDAGIALD